MKSDFEKLVVAQKYVEALKKEVGQLKEALQKEREEKRRLEEDLEAEKERKEKMTPEERYRIKSELRAQQMDQTVKNLKTKLDKAQKESEQLRAQVIRMKRERGDS